MNDELSPYEGQNWLCLTDAELRQLAGCELRADVLEKVQRLEQALDQRLADNAKLTHTAEVITARTDRGGLLTDGDAD